MTPRDIATDLWGFAGLDNSALSALRLTGRESVLPSSFRVVAAAQASIGAAGLAAVEIFRARAGRSQTVSVDALHASVEFRSEHYIRDAASPSADMWDAIAGVYPCADGWVRLHTNFPHHRDGLLALLGCAGTRAAVAASLSTRNTAAFESEASEAGMCVAAMRSFAQWDAHPHAAAVAEVPLLIERIGEAPPEPFRPGATRPLSAVRVLDLTRVIAGPVGGRTLAAHGADVLHVTGPHVPNLPRLVQDTGRGKRATEIDLDTEAGRARLAVLVRGADVFLQSYRPGALAKRGFGAEALAVLRPGIVVATLSAYGERGSWAGKRGFDSLVQTATGFNQAEAEAAGIAQPKPLPCQALDHASGYLLAFGTMAALLRRMREGGSWRVAVSLAATARWLRSLGRREDGFALPDITADDVAPLLETAGPVSAVRHAAHLSATPAFWARPAEPLGSSPALWETR